MRRPALMIVLAIGCNNGADRAMKKFEHSKIKLAEMQVRQLALEAFPMWAAAHPEAACPASLDELKQYTNLPDLVDPWTHPFKMLCGASLPPDVHGLAVYSVGGDGQPETADDVKSWAPATN